MPFDERVQAVAKKGFTERQARFLTTVMLHSRRLRPTPVRPLLRHRPRREDAEVLRQAGAARTARRCTTAGTTVPASTTSTSGRSTRPSASQTARSADRMSINRAIQRLMVLDAIVEDPELVWLATAEDKAANLTGAHRRSRRQTCRTPPLARAMLARSATSRNASRSGSIPPAEAFSSTSSTVRTWTTSGCFLSATRRCSVPCQPGRSASSHLRSFLASAERARKAVEDQLAEADEGRHHRRDAVVLRAASSLVAERHRALQSLPSGLLYAAESGDLRTVEARRRSRPRQRQQRGHRPGRRDRSRPHRGPRTRSPVRSSLSPGCRLLNTAPGGLRRHWWSQRSQLRQLRGAVEQLGLQPSAQLLNLVDRLFHLQRLD